MLQNLECKLLPAAREFPKTKPQANNNTWKQIRKKPINKCTTQKPHFSDFKKSFAPLSNPHFCFQPAENNRLFCNSDSTKELERR